MKEYCRQLPPLLQRVLVLFIQRVKMILLGDIQTVIPAGIKRRRRRHKNRVEAGRPEGHAYTERQKAAARSASRITKDWKLFTKTTLKR